MSMISRSERRGIPRHLSDCNGKDPVSQRLWFWARMYERVALTALWLGLLITVALVVLIATNVLAASELLIVDGAEIIVPVTVGVVGLILSLTAYFNWNAKAVNTASQAAMVENTRVCADVALYEAYTKDGNTPEVVVTMPTMNSSSVSAPKAAYAPAAAVQPTSQAAYAPAATVQSTSQAAYAPAAATQPVSQAAYAPAAATQPVSPGSQRTPSMSVMSPVAASAYVPATVLVQEPVSGTIKTPSGNTMEFIRSVSAICSSCGKEKTCGEYRVIMPDGRNSKISHYCDECVAKKTVEQ